jgi:predicted ATPase with chaperone activity
MPDRLEGLGIPRSLVSDLILRYLWLHGSATLSSLHQTLKLSFPVLETVFHQFRQQQLLEVKGMVGNDYSFMLTGSGRSLAAARNEICQYVGPAPVSIQEYHRVVQSQSAHVRLSRESLRQAFHDLVLPDTVLDQLGPSLIGHQSLFLYGGTGNGKTSIAERILRIYEDTVLVPYAVEVDGHILTLFDPVVHRPVPATDDLLDPRWIRCERPCITVGGELSASMLELRLDDDTRVFIAPCQMKANNGILIIDDFGRQMLSPRELLNRWIVPLDRRVDYLSLSSGMKFQVPFELMVVFSTNLNPYDLADEAFLRRIQTKVRVESVTPEVFDQIFQRVIQNVQVPCEPGSTEYLRERCLASGAKYLRACYPMDIYKLVKAISEYEGRPVRMTRGNIDRAVALYFAKEGTPTTD